MKHPKDPQQSGTFARKLTKYSVATVGGVAGMTAGFEASEAALVITETTITLTDNLTGTGSPQFKAQLDLNGDAAEDVNIMIFSASLLTAMGMNGAALAGTLGTGGFFYPNAFTTSNVVGGGWVNPGQGKVFSGGSLSSQSFGTMANSVGTAGPQVGNWLGGVTAYLGVEFDISGDTHYGWVHVTWNPAGAGASTATIHGYAYEDLANTQAHVPEPSSLALLGLGAMGLAARRRRPSKG